MMPLADMVAFSTSVSNHWSSRSAALIVMSCSRLCWSAARELLEALAEAGEARRSPARRSENGSGGTMDRIGFTKRAISTIAFAYSS